MSTIAPALTINVHETAKNTLPAELEARLSGSPKSPEELAETLRAHEQRSASLRRLHLESIKDRAARDEARRDEAKLRKLRLTSSYYERVANRLDQAAMKADAKKEEKEAERMARKVKREEAARQVMAARQAALEAKKIRYGELSVAVANAYAKHGKVIAETKSKGAAQVQHAIAVAAAHKEKAALDAAALGEKLREKLAAAETRRELDTSPSGAAIATSPKRKANLHRVLNESKVEAETKAKSLAASMNKAAENRAAHLAGVQAKAEAVCERAAAVVAKSKAKSDGTDTATCKAKAALYERLVSADSARLVALKAKYGALHAVTAAAGVIVVDMTDVLDLRKPPSALALRLSVCKRHLLATASARQAGAEARRRRARLALLGKLAAAAERRAGAIARVAARLAAKAAAADAKAQRAMNAKALADGARAFVVATQRAKAKAAALKRSALDAQLKAVGEAKAAAVAAAAERRDAKRRAVAKSGVLAVRLAANRSRREARVNAKLARAATLRLACTAAAAKRAEFLAERVAIAKKHMVAKHPKREVGDMETPQ